jgi:hypothetical protein
MRYRHEPKTRIKPANAALSRAARMTMECCDPLRHLRATVALSLDVEAAGRQQMQHTNLRVGPTSKETRAC